MQSHLMPDILQAKCQYKDTCPNKKKNCEVFRMSAVSKVLVPNKTWIIEEGGIKIGTLNKEKKGFSFYSKGAKFEIRDLGAVKNYLGINALDQEPIKSIKKTTPTTVEPNVYDFPCASRPHNPVYNIIKKLPIYAKSSKSKSLYCAGYYVIRFRKGWVKSFCPKLITLERYEFKGPFKTESEMRTTLNTVSKE